MKDVKLLGNFRLILLSHVSSLLVFSLQEDEVVKMQELPDRSGSKDLKEPPHQDGALDDEIPPSTPLNHTSITIEDGEKHLEAEDGIQSKCWTVRCSLS